MNDLDGSEAVLVVAWGNPLREDDGVAWHVLEGLRSLNPRASLPALTLRYAHQLTPEMADCVSRSEGAVFVDARRDGTPGEVRCEEITPSAGPSPLAHSLSPQALLLLAEQLYGRAPTAVVLSVTGERFGMGEALSAAVRRSLPRAIVTVIRQAKAWAKVSPQAVQTR